MEIMNIKQDGKCYDGVDKSSTSCTKKKPSSFCMWTNESLSCSLDLVDNSSNLKAKQALYHQTPHHYACSKGRLPIVEYFIEKESYIYIKAKAQCQRTPLHNACEFCHLQHVEYLIVITNMVKHNYGKKLKIPTTETNFQINKNKKNEMMILMDFFHFFQRIQQLI